MNDALNTNNAAADILAEIQSGIERVQSSGGSFDIELTEEQYEAYKKSLSAIGPKSEAPTSAPTPAPVVQTTTEFAATKPQAVEQNKIKLSVTNESAYTFIMREFDLLKKIPRLGARYNAIENILSTVKTSPSEYGISSGDIMRLTPGDKIEVGKISEVITNTIIAEKNIIDHANSLPDIVVSGIEEYMPKDIKSLLSAPAPVPVEKSTNIIKIKIDQRGDHTLMGGHREALLESGHEEADTTPMTASEANNVLGSLKSEMKLHNIEWGSLLEVGADNALAFSKKEKLTIQNEKIAALIKIHFVKTNVPIGDKLTVLEYLQMTVLWMARQKD